MVSNDPRFVKDAHFEDSCEDETEKEGASKVNNKKGRKRPTDDGCLNKRGVCYLSRVPPRMNPSHIRQILSNYGDIERVYLAPEDSSVKDHHKQQRKFLGKEFSEGWVEFMKKSDAKRAANILNGMQIGGKKRSSFYFDIWNIKYLRKFKWDDLVSETANKSHVRQQKLMLEISAAKRERDFYLTKVERSRALEFIKERRMKKQKIEGEPPQMVEPKATPCPSTQSRPTEEPNVLKKKLVSGDVLTKVFGGS